MEGLDAFEGQEKRFVWSISPSSSKSVKRDFVCLFTYSVVSHLDLFVS